MFGELYIESIRWYNLPWSLMLVLMLMYWAFSIISSIDLDFLNIDFDMDADADLDGDVDVDSPGGSAFAGILEFIHLGSLPLMVVLTGLVICAWSLSLIGNYYLNPSNLGLIGFSISIAVSLPGLVLSSLALWPVAIFYKRLEDKTDGNLTMVGRTCSIRSDRVDASFGQAEVRTSEGPLVVNVRLATESAPLAEGDAALIISEDKEHMVYTVRRISKELAKI